MAGTTKMRWRKFLVANASGGIAWAAIFTTAAYLAGHVLERVSTVVAWVLGGVAVVAIGAGLLVVRRRMDRLAVRAEAAYPGPLQ
jgi:membrane protein DedA with SNARE-associated domain